MTIKIDLEKEFITAQNYFFKKYPDLKWNGDLSQKIYQYEFTNEDDYLYLSKRRNFYLIIDLEVNILTYRYDLHSNNYFDFTNIIRKEKFKKII